MLLISVHFTVSAELLHLKANGSLLICSLRLNDNRLFFYNFSKIFENTGSNGSGL